METSFFSGSENLYKYLVTIGLLLIVMTVYYPLREKQELEILNIQVNRDLEALKYKLTNNLKNVKVLSASIGKNGNSPENVNMLAKYDAINQENNISQIEINKKKAEIECRKSHIKLYSIMFWTFFPIGILLSIFGFVKWKKGKVCDDEIKELERKKLDLEVKKLTREEHNAS